jgi:hypothetical protein
MRWGIPILMILGTLSGCESPSAKRPANGPTLSELAPKVPDQSWDDVRNLPRPALLANVLIAKYDLSLDSDLEKSWKMISTKELSKTQVAAWKANGMRVGVLNPRQTNAFIRQLPISEGRRLQRFSGTQQYEPVELIKGKAGITSAGKINFYWPNKPPQEIQMRKGRWQFLARCQRHGPNVYLELMPHHHRRKISLKPRTQYEMDLDGTMFTQLTIRASLQPSQYLVVVLDPTNLKVANPNAQVPQAIGNAPANPNVAGVPANPNVAGGAANQAPNPGGLNQQPNQKPPKFKRDSIGGHLLVANSVRGTNSKVKMLLIISFRSTGASPTRPNGR